MTKRRLIRILIPLLVALVVTIAVAKLTTKPKAPTVSVVVAAAQVSAGSILTTQDLQVLSVPAASALPGSIGSVSQAIGVITRVDLTAGDPVLADELQPTQSAGLAYQIPAGERALTVQVNGVTGVGGSLGIGNTVDVLGTFPSQSSTTGVSSPAYAAVVVQNVTVLQLSSGTGGTTATQSGNGSPYTLVTLAVTPTEAATISLAEQQGGVTFLLRPHSGAGNGTADVGVGGLK